MQHKTLVVVDFEAILDRPLLSTVIGEGDERLFFQDIISPNVYRSLCKGQPVVLNNQTIHGMQNYLEEKSREFQEELDKFSAHIVICAKVSDRIKNLSKSAYHVTEAWKNFLQYSRRATSSSIVITIAIEYPKDFIEACTGILFGADVGDHDILISPERGSMASEAKFWVDLMPNTYQPAVARNTNYKSIVYVFDSDFAYKTAWNRSARKRIESRIRLCMAFEKLMINSSNFPTEDLHFSSEDDACINIPEKLREIGNEVTRPKNNLFAFCQDLRMQAEYLLSPHRSGDYSCRSDRDRCALDSLRVLVKYSLGQTSFQYDPNEPYSIDLEEVLHYNFGGHRDRPLRIFHYLIFLNGYNASNAAQTSKSNALDDVRIWNRYHRQRASIADENDIVNSAMRFLSICADGAIDTHNLAQPNYVVGDFDSLHASSVENYDTSHIEFQHFPDQNNTDFDKTLLFVNNTIHKGVARDREQFRSNIDALKESNKLSLDENSVLPLPLCSALILGAGGGRKDHEFGIYYTLLKNVHLYRFLVAKMENNLIFAIAPQRNYTITGIQKGTKCGIIPFGVPTMEIITDGLEWNTDGVFMGFAHSSKRCDLHDIRIISKNSTTCCTYSERNQCRDMTQIYIPTSLDCSADLPILSTSNVAVGEDARIPVELLLCSMVENRDGSFKCNARTKPSSDKGSSLSHVSIEICSLHSPVLLTISCG